MAVTYLILIINYGDNINKLETHVNFGTFFIYLNRIYLNRKRFMKIYTTYLPCTQFKIIYKRLCSFNFICHKIINQSRGVVKMS